MNQNQIQKQQQENTEIQYPQTTEITYPYSVRIEQSAKGARISVHCYNRYLELGSEGSNRGLSNYSQTVKRCRP